MLRLLFDVDNDGMTDLIVGNSVGRLFYSGQIQERRMLLKIHPIFRALTLGYVVLR
jgi:hypothetical protein